MVDMAHVIDGLRFGDEIHVSTVTGIFWLLCYIYMHVCLVSKLHVQ